MFPSSILSSPNPLYLHTYTGTHTHRVTQSILIKVASIFKVPNSYCRKNRFQLICTTLWVLLVSIRSPWKNVCCLEEMAEKSQSLLIYRRLLVNKRHKIQEIRFCLFQLKFFMHVSKYWEIF